MTKVAQEIWKERPASTVVAAGSSMYAKISWKRSKMQILRSGVTSVRRQRDGRYKVCFPPSPHPPFTVIAAVEGNDAAETCLGLVPALVGNSTDDEVVYDLGRVPRWSLSISIGTMNRRSRRYDHVLVSAWRFPTVKTLAEAKKAVSEIGKCDFIVQIVWP